MDQKQNTGTGKEKKGANENTMTSGSSLTGSAPVEDNSSPDDDDNEESPKNTRLSNSTGNDYRETRS